MRLNKILSGTLIAATCISLCACGNNNNANSDGNNSNSGNNGTISVSIWDNNQLAGLKEITDDFTAETGIPVDIQVVPWDQYWTTLEAGVMGGELPDVFWMHSNYSQMYMDNGVLLDLTDRIAESDMINLDNYYKEITELYQLDGKTYAIPKDYDTIALWYNKKMFDEAGIAYPDETWTWQTLADAAKKLTKEDGSQYGFALPAGFTQDGYYNLIYDMGGYILSEDKTKSGWDDPKTIDSMNWLYDNVVSVSMPSQQIMGETTPDVLFNSGKVAMIMQGSWMVASMKQNEYALENGDVAVLPMADDGTRISICNGLGWAASAQGDNTENAWKLLEYFGSEKAQKKQAELGVTMSAYTGTSETWINCAPEFNLQAYLDMTENMVLRPYTRETKAWEDYSQETMKKAYTGENTMEEVCRDIAAFMNQCIAEEN